MGRAGHFIIYRQYSFPKIKHSNEIADTRAFRTQ